MGETLSFKKGYRVYDAQNQLRATIRKAPTKKEESRRFLLALILAFMPAVIFVALLGLSLTMPSVSSALDPLWPLLMVSCFGAVIFGLILFAYLAHKGRFGKPKWLIEDPEGRQLAEGNDFWVARHLKILTPDGGVITRIRTKRGLPPSYHINISRQGFDPLLILSYTVIMLHRHRETVSSAASGRG